MLLTSAFLFVVSTPDLGLAFLIHAVMNGFGVWVFGARIVFPRKDIERAVSSASASGIS